MKKRVIPALVALSLCLTGCAAIVNGEYSSSNPHAVITAPQLMPDENTVSVKTPEELRTVLTGFIESHVEHARLRFSEYAGDAAADLSAACFYVSSATPLGAYGVYYVNHSLNRITSYYEADISIIYSRTPEEMASVERIEAADFAERLRAAVDGRRSSFAFLLESGSVAQEELDGALDGLYYSNPQLVYRPEGSVTAYPDAGESRIFEVVLTFPYSAFETQERSAEINAQLDALLEGLGEAEGDSALNYIIGVLAAHAEFDEELEGSDEYSRWFQAYTSYGALVQKRATGEGFAMAMKLMCDRAGIECLVVTGMLNNVSHGWNIVTLENGRTYHVDVSLYSPESGPVPFRTDSQMAASYRWDTSRYPACADSEE